MSQFWRWLLLAVFPPPPAVAGSGAQQRRWRSWLLLAWVAQLALPFLLLLAARRGALLWDTLLTPAEHTYAALPMADRLLPHRRAWPSPPPPAQHSLVFPAMLCGPAFVWLRLLCALLSSHVHSLHELLHPVFIVMVSRLGCLLPVAATYSLLYGICRRARFDWASRLATFATSFVTIVVHGRPVVTVLQTLLLAAALNLYLQLQPLPGDPPCLQLRLPFGSRKSTTHMPLPTPALAAVVLVALLTAGLFSHPSFFLLATVPIGTAWLCDTFRVPIVLDPAARGFGLFTLLAIVMTTIAGLLYCDFLMAETWFLGPWRQLQEMRFFSSPAALASSPVGIPIPFLCWAMFGPLWLILICGVAIVSRAGKSRARRCWQLTVWPHARSPTDGVSAARMFRTYRFCMLLLGIIVGGCINAWLWPREALLHMCPVLLPLSLLGGFWVMGSHATGRHNSLWLAVNITAIAYLCTTHQAAVATESLKLAAVAASQSVNGDFQQMHVITLQVPPAAPHIYNRYELQNDTCRFTELYQATTPQEMIALLVHLTTPNIVQCKSYREQRTAFIVMLPAAFAESLRAVDVTWQPLFPALRNIDLSGGMLVASQDTRIVTLMAVVSTSRLPDGRCLGLPACFASS